MKQRIGGILKQNGIGFLNKSREETRWQIGVYQPKHLMFNDAYPFGIMQDWKNISLHLVVIT
ncbi:MAG: hypothetical protein RQ735_03455 [Flavobacteriaceae bacterium]|nr:hypothetical protein [Flavobacteriaceae bacterium]